MNETGNPLTGLPSRVKACSLRSFSFPVARISGADEVGDHGLEDAVRDRGEQAEGPRVAGVAHFAAVHVQGPQSLGVVAEQHLLAALAVQVEQLDAGQVGPDDLRKARLEGKRRPRFDDGFAFLPETRDHEL